MKKLISCLIAAFISTPAFPCSTISVSQNTQPFVGKNYDWMQTMARLYVNKRNVKKAGLIFRPGDQPAQWISKYGSLTFNQFGREFPHGGINEAGLIIEIMWLTQSVYPPSDSRPTVNELQWIQYMLDNYASVADMVADADKLRVQMVTAPVHYLACDSTMACATFEFLSGKMIAHSGADLPYASLTNDNYVDSLAALREHIGFGGTKPIPMDTSSLSRFVRGTALAQSITDGDIQIQTFDLLDQISQSNTVWQIAYDMKNKKVHFRTSDHRNIKSVDLKQLEWSCKTQVTSHDIQTTTSGLINDLFTPYDAIQNEKWVRDAINTLPTDLPPEMRALIIQKVSTYPSTTTCAE